MKKITLEQKNQIHGTFFALNMRFNCVQGVDNEWYISEEESLQSDLQWLKDVPSTEFISKVIKSPMDN